jgi:hypothetical protein
MPGLVGPADREPSKVQQDILAFIRDYTRCRRYSPSYQEIGHFRWRRHHHRKSNGRLAWRPLMRCLTAA